MPLFHLRIIEKHLKTVKAAPPIHATIIKAWAENLAAGVYNSETKIAANDNAFLRLVSHRRASDIVRLVSTYDSADRVLTRSIL